MSSKNISEILNFVPEVTSAEKLRNEHEVENTGESSIAGIIGKCSRNREFEESLLIVELSL